MAFQEFTPIQYLMIDVASNYGLSKTSWDHRLHWFKDHENQLKKLSEIPVSQKKELLAHPLIKEASDPALFFAGVKAWAQAMKGEAIGYPISLDATASGAQILSALIDCEQSARMCNVVNTGNREDLYTNIYEGMRKRAEDQIDEDTSGELELAYQPLARITPSEVKHATVAAIYGSKRRPRDLFGEGMLLGLYYQTLEEDLPGAWALNKALIDQWQPYAFSHDWILPDNFHVKIKTMELVGHSFEFGGRRFEAETYENVGTKRGLSLGANIVHSVDGLVVREMLRRCNYDSTKLEALLRVLKGQTPVRFNPHHPHAQLITQLWDHYTESGFLSARILELLDAETIGLVDPDVIRDMVGTLPEKPFPVMPVHD